MMVMVMVLHHLLMVVVVALILFDECTSGIVLIVGHVSLLCCFIRVSCVAQGFGLLLREGDITCCWGGRSNGCGWFSSDDDVDVSCTWCGDWGCFHFDRVAHDDGQFWFSLHGGGECDRFDDGWCDISLDGVIVC